MTSEKQMIANQLNAQLSTGPKTVIGKTVVATNAIKHGIFTKDLIVPSALAKEDGEEYFEMLNNLTACLTPQNQIESLLVEKIAIDFWRLRRVIRFESGCIGKYLETIFKEFYTYSRKNNDEIELEIQEKRKQIAWMTSYIEYLRNEEVSFDEPTWKGKDIKSDILDDVYFIIKTLDKLTYEEKEKLQYDVNNFSKLKKILQQNGYTSKKEISTKLIEIYLEQHQQLEQDIEDLKQKQLTNIEADKLNSMIGLIPHEDNTDKILKYDRSLQKSIFQNIIMLKKLQESI